MNIQRIKAEFHCHTCHSPDSLVKVEKLIETCRAKGINRVAITDHNSIAGALEAKQIAPEMVIVGEEIETTEGELIAYFLTEEIPAGLSPTEVFRRLKAQDAFISISHPFDLQRNGHWTEQKLEALVPDLDGMEVFNARCIMPRYNQEAAAFAKRHQLAGLAGSDAHSLKELGRAVVLLPEFDSTGGLRLSLKSAELSTNLSSPLIHFVSSVAKLVKKASSKPTKAK